jgi:hypothetical protein
MTGAWHRIYLLALIGTGFLVFVFLLWTGYGYYTTPFTERPFHEQHGALKPSGPFGHGFGILGTLMILVGVFTYIGRKRNKFLPRVGALKHWLEFHIFLCSVGPLFILFHTAFKFGGIVSVSFWSMVAVVLSGVIGRFIYIQIPRTIHGRELSLGEIRELRGDMRRELEDKYALDEQLIRDIDTLVTTHSAEQQGGALAQLWRSMSAGLSTRPAIGRILRQTHLSGKERKAVARLVQRELVIAGRINRLQTMQQLFKYWHVAHLPFALVMLIIMVIHVAITLAFGYRWIF